MYRDAELLPFFFADYRFDPDCQSQFQRVNAAACKSTQ